MAVFDVIGKRIVRFRRLNNQHIAGYMIYGVYDDSSYPSGTRTESLLKDSFGKDLMYENPELPCLDPDEIKVIDLEWNNNVTWELPEDAFYDKDHRFKLYMNGSPLPKLYYDYNKLTRRFTINTTLKPCSASDTFKLEYYRDYIKIEFTLDTSIPNGDPKDIIIKPVFRHGYRYGYHNIII